MKNHIFYVSGLILYAIAIVLLCIVPIQYCWHVVFIYFAIAITHLLLSIKLKWI